MKFAASNVAVACGTGSKGTTLGWSMRTGFRTASTCDSAGARASSTWFAWEEHLNEVLTLDQANGHFK
ncbi:hypothetical protein DPMN_051628 [Dreissena polymorpha]|uniref:Uncharacterized protein n=1 Tax=Dreissena polymorpha TaxID=45954 RepID=A0A9D4CI65_DREPO|nr:hypothetical protein DPMN_051628 [Dreissena polymorpha]